jgi:hypothetical protein
MIVRRGVVSTGKSWQMNMTYIPDRRLTFLGGGIPIANARLMIADCSTDEIHACSPLSCTLWMLAGKGPNDSPMRCV